VKKLLPWETAKAVLKPDNGDDEQAKKLDRLGFLRSVAGLVAVFVLSVDYQPAADLLIGSPGGAVASNAALALAAVPVCVAALFAASPARFRPDLRAGLRKLLRRAGIAVGTVGLPLVPVFVLDPTDMTARLPALVILVLVVALVWFLAYFLCVIYWAARTVFWIGALHPMLAPLASSVLGRVLTVEHLLGGDSKGLPVGVWLMIVGSGLVSTIVLAAAEYRHLHDTGIRLRTGPGAVPPDQRPCRTGRPGVPARHGRRWGVTR
jgi:hypothetical protein